MTPRDKQLPSLPRAVFSAIGGPTPSYAAWTILKDIEQLSKGPGPGPDRDPKRRIYLSNAYLDAVKSVKSVGAIYAVISNPLSPAVSSTKRAVHKANALRGSQSRFHVYANVVVCAAISHLRPGTYKGVKEA